MILTSPQHLGLNPKGKTMTIHEDLAILSTLDQFDHQSIVTYLMGHDPALFIAAVTYARSIKRSGMPPVEEPASLVGTDSPQRCTYDNHQSVVVERPDYEVGIDGYAYCDACGAHLEVDSEYDGETLRFFYVGNVPMSYKAR
jgi:hypothetical protein